MIEKNIQEIQFIAGQWPLQESRPTIVFIHGAGNSSMFWKAQVEGLAGTMNTVAIDLPGHGQSAGNGRASIADYAMIVAEFMEAIKIPTPVPCGLSMGGAITLQLLIDSRDRYKAGIVINSGARLKVAPMIFDLIKNNYQGFADALSMFAASAKTDPARLQGIIEDTRKCNPEIAYNDFLACNEFDVMTRLGEISAPVLVLTAEDDQLSPPKFGQFLAEKIAGARHVSISAAGHMSPVEKPEDVNQAISDFIHTAILQ